MIRSTAIVLRYSAEVARLQSRYARIAATIRAEEANLLGWLAKLNRRLERRLVRG